MNNSWNTGMKCYGLYAGGTTIVLLSGNTGGGDSTTSEVGLIRQAYNTGGNGEYIHIAGQSAISYSIDNDKNIVLTASTDNVRYLLITIDSF